MFRETAASLLILSALGAAAGRAAQTLELASRVDPSQYSDTAAGGNPEGFGRAPFLPALSADGRYVAFISAATHLVPGQQDVNGGQDEVGGDVFLKDLQTGTVTLVSHAQGLPTVTGNRSSSMVALSADGRWVAYVSDATDLVPGQEGNAFTLPDSDLLLFDRITGATTLVAADPLHQGAFQSLALSADGRYLVFGGSGAFVPGQQGETDDYDVFIYDRVSGTNRLASHLSGLPTTGGGAEGYSQISADGRYTLFSSYSTFVPGQPTDSASLFLYDRVTDSLTLVSSELQNVPQLSADGKYVLFCRQAGPMLLYSRETRATIQVAPSAGNFQTFYAAAPQSLLSTDGRYVAYLGSQQTPSGAILQVKVFDRVSRTTTGVPRGSGDNPFPPAIESAAISGDGRFVAFTSTDFHQVPGQVDPLRTSANFDLFLYDRTAGKTTLVSHTAAAALTTGDGDSYSPVLSANGSRLVFTSAADDLVDDLADLNEAPDLFVYDVSGRSLDVVTRRAESLPALSPGAGSHLRALSADGRYVAFDSTSAHIVAGQKDTNGKSDVFLFDATRKATVLVSHVPSSATTAPQGESSHPAVSADGRFVVFLSNARNLVPGANPAGQICVFLWDHTTGGVTFIARAGNVNPDFFLPTAVPRISPDGRWIAFVSTASDLIAGQQDPGTVPESISNVFLWDRLTQAFTLVSHSASGPLVEGFGSSDTPVLSDDGRFVAFHSGAADLVVPGQTQGGNDLFLFDRTTGAIVLVSRSRSSATGFGGAFSQPVLSADGRFLLFSTFAGGLDPNASSDTSNLFLYDGSLKTYQQVSSFVDSPPSQHLSLSADGRFAAFVGEDMQIYLYDRVAKTLTLASRRPDGFGGNGDCDTPVLSADGRYVAFVSEAQDLVAGQIPAPGRGEDETSAYLYDRVAGTVILLSRWQGSPVTAAGYAGNPLISADGQRIAFDSGIDLVEGDYNRQSDAYLFSLSGGSTGGGGPVTVPPCILLDTRRSTDGPALHSNVARVVKATGLCGVPATAKRIIAKVTAFQGTGKGNVRFYPGDLSQPSTGILRFSRGQTAAATFDLPLAPGAGTLTLLPFVAGNGTAGVSVEVDGYTP